MIRPKLKRRKYRVYSARVPLEQKLEIAKFIVLHPHLNHKERAYMMGVKYSMAYRVYQEMIEEEITLRIKAKYLPVPTYPEED